MSQSSPSSRETGHRIIAAIPCFNTEHFIADIVSRAREYVNQVVVIDDGSYDDTAQVARAAGALVVGHEVNKGYGEAIRQTPPVFWLPSMAMDSMTRIASRKF